MINVLTFVVNSISFGVESTYIDGIIEKPELEYEDDNGIIDGLITYRGKTLPQVNLGLYLYNKSNKESSNNLIICKNAIALSVDNITGIKRVDEKDNIKLHGLMKNMTQIVKCVIHDENNELIQLLDVENIANKIE